MTYKRFTPADLSRLGKEYREKALADPEYPKVKQGGEDKFTAEQTAYNYRYRRFGYNYLPWPFRKKTVAGTVQAPVTPEQAAVIYNYGTEPVRINGVQQPDTSKEFEALKQYGFQPRTPGQKIDRRNPDPNRNLSGMLREPGLYGVPKELEMGTLIDPYRKRELEALGKKVREAEINAPIEEVPTRPGPEDEEPLMQAVREEQSRKLTRQSEIEKAIQDYNNIMPEEFKVDPKYERPQVSGAAAPQVGFSKNVASFLSATGGNTKLDVALGLIGIVMSPEVKILQLVGGAKTVVGKAMIKAFGEKISAIRIGDILTDSSKNKWILSGINPETGDLLVNSIKEDLQVIRPLNEFVRADPGFGRVAEEAAEKAAKKGGAKSMKAAEVVENAAEFDEMGIASSKARARIEKQADLAEIIDTAVNAGVVPEKSKGVQLLEKIIAIDLREGEAKDPLYRMLLGAEAKKIRGQSWRDIAVLMAKSDLKTELGDLKKIETAKNALEGMSKTARLKAYRAAKAGIKAGELAPDAEKLAKEVITEYEAKYAAKEVVEEVAEEAPVKVAKDTGLRYDPQTGQYNGKTLVRGDVLTGEDGTDYVLDRANGFMLTLDQRGTKGGVIKTISVSVDPGDTDRYMKLAASGDNVYGKVPGRNLEMELTPPPAATKELTGDEKLAAALSSKPNEPTEDNIAALVDMLDEENKAASLKKLEKRLDKAGWTEDEVEGVDDLRSAIDEYRGIEKSGMSPEDYLDEKETAWAEIQDAADNLVPAEREVDEVVTAAAEAVPAQPAAATESVVEAATPTPADEAGAAAPEAPKEPMWRGNGPPEEPPVRPTATSAGGPEPEPGSFLARAANGRKLLDKISNHFKGKGAGWKRPSWMETVSRARGEWANTQEMAYENLLKMYPKWSPAQISRALNGLTRGNKVVRPKGVGLMDFFTIDELEDISAYATEKFAARQYERMASENLLYYLAGFHKPNDAGKLMERIDIKSGLPIGPLPFNQWSAAQRRIMKKLLGDDVYASIGLVAKEAEKPVDAGLKVSVQQSVKMTEEIAQAMDDEAKWARDFVKARKGDPERNPQPFIHLGDKPIDVPMIPKEDVPLQSEFPGMRAGNDYAANQTNARVADWGGPIQPEGPRPDFVWPTYDEILDQHQEYAKAIKEEKLGGEFGQLTQEDKLRLIKQAELWKQERIDKLAAHIAGDIEARAGKMWTPEHFLEMRNAAKSHAFHSGNKKLQEAVGVFWDQALSDAYPNYFTSHPMPQTWGEMGAKQLLLPRTMLDFAQLPPNLRERFVAGLKKTGSTVVDILGVAKTFKSSLDISMPFRQGLILGAYSPKKWASSWKPMIRGLMNEEVAGALEDEINRSFLKKMAISGIRAEDFQWVLNDAPTIARGAAYEQRLETRASKWLENLGFGEDRKYNPIRASQRAATLFVRKLQLDTFADMAGAIRIAGGGAADYKSAAQFTNWAVGRGSIPKQMVGLAPTFNALLFSPRMVMSRLQLPMKLLAENKIVRKAAWRSLAGILGFGTSVLALSALVSGKLPETDARSADFGKAKFGDTRVDIWAGYLQWLRFARQVMTGETKTQLGDIRPKSRLQILWQLYRSKESPIAGLTSDLFAGETREGQPVEMTWDSVTQLAGNQFLSLAWIDLLESTFPEGAKGGPKWQGLLGLGAFVGIGVQSYQKPNAVNSLKMKAAKYRDAVTKVNEALLVYDQAKAQKLIYQNKGGSWNYEDGKIYSESFRYLSKVERVMADVDRQVRQVRADKTMSAGEKTAWLKNAEAEKERYASEAWEEFERMEAEGILRFQK